MSLSSSLARYESQLSAVTAVPIPMEARNRVSALVNESRTLLVRAFSALRASATLKRIAPPTDALGQALLNALDVEPLYTGKVSRVQFVSNFQSVAQELAKHAVALDMPDLSASINEHAVEFPADLEKAIKGQALPVWAIPAAIAAVGLAGYFAYRAFSKMDEYEPEDALEDFEYSENEDEDEDDFAEGDEEDAEFEDA